MKRTLLPVLALGILLLSACSALAETQVIHYVNKDFGFSVDYPKGWLLEEINPNEIGIKPKDSEYNQIQIGAFSGEPIMGSLPESQVAALTEAMIQQFFDMLGGTNLNVFINEPASGKWNWTASFTVIYEGTPLQGVFLIKETQTACYTLMLIQCLDWPEGQEVMNSFRLTE
jgi:hypothetical protein